MNFEPRKSNYGPKAHPQPTTKRNIDIGSEEFYPTPPWATAALISYEEFEGDIWEPACGDGSMSEVLKKTGCNIYSSDLYDRGYGDGGVDFLTSQRRAVNIVTNPPYALAAAFVHHGLKLAKTKVALLLRLAFLESGARYRDIFSTLPPARVYVFSERITFYPKNVERKGSGTTAYCWMVWDKKSNGIQTQLCWLRPGFKKAAPKEEMLF